MKIKLCLYLWCALLPSAFGSKTFRCGIEVHAKGRTISDSRLYSRLGRTMQAAAKHASHYPWKFDLEWNATIGYFWREQVTGTLLLIQGDNVAFISPLDDEIPNFWHTTTFPQSLTKFWAESLQKADVLQKNADALGYWFTHYVYPTLLALDFEHAAHILNERELTKAEFNFLVTRVSLIQDVTHLPPFRLSKLDNQLVQFSVRRPLVGHEWDGIPKSDLFIGLHTRCENGNAAHLLLERFEGSEVSGLKGDRKLGWNMTYETPTLLADTYSITHALNVLPEDDLSDLLFGLAAEGEELLDVYPRRGTFSLTDGSRESEYGMWKKFVEKFIREFGLQPAIAAPHGKPTE